MIIVAMGVYLIIVSISVWILVVLIMIEKTVQMLYTKK